MHNDLNDAIIVRSVVDLGHNLGLQTVAEGVEDHQTWDQLAQLGCNDAQGYFLARPMPPGEFMAWLQASEHPVTTGVDVGRRRDHLVEPPPHPGRAGGGGALDRRWRYFVALRHFSTISLEMRPRGATLMRLALAQARTSVRS